MKQFLLATTLIALPVIVFAAVETWVVPPSPTAAIQGAPLGDLSAYEAIVNATQDLAGAGDLTAAKTKITAFETKWDDAEFTLRPKAPAAWGNVDTAADVALSALRAGQPDPAKVKSELAALAIVLANPAGNGTSSGGVKTVAGIAVTDAGGHAIPCEAMLSNLRAALTGGAIAGADKPKAADLQSKATERCNADDDTRADAVAAEALALAAHQTPPEIPNPETPK